MNAKRSLVHAAAVVAVIVTGVVRAEDEPVLLRHRIEKDQPLIYRTSTSTEQVQTVMDRKLTTTIDQTDVSLRTLEKIDDDGNVRVRSENKRLKVTVKSVGGDFKFDSSAAEREKGNELSAALNPLYERMSGSVLTLVVTPRGEVKDVEGLDMLLADLLKDNPLAAQFAGGGDKKAGKLSQQEAIDQFPEGPVKTGDQWEIPYEMELPKLGKATGKRVYTVEGADKVGERETIRLGVTLEMTFDVDLETNGAKITGRLSVSESAGTVQFDPKMGQTVSKKAKYTIGGALSVNVAGQVIPVQSDQTQKVSVELLDKLPE